MTKVHLPWLDSHNPHAPFPDAEEALDYPEGLVAAGGDLSSPRLLHAYKKGIFPWYEQGQPILWWSPNPRGIIYPKDFIAHRSLLRSLRRNNWRISYDTAFREVIRACAEARAYSKNTWITQDMQNAYCNLHQLHHAHSVEVWDNNNYLVGGIYGISIGSIFFGESMFSRRTDASKAALLFLCAYVDLWGYKLIDTQLTSKHLSSLGGCEMSRSKYLETVEICTQERVSEDAWQDQQTIDIKKWLTIR
jgi:leucyl/phenylalanyl-tRNA--protein transferase